MLCSIWSTLMAWVWPVTGLFTSISLTGCLLGWAVKVRGGPGMCAFSTLTIQRLVTTSSWSPPSFGSVGPWRGVQGKSGSSGRTWCFLSTGFHWWSWRPRRLLWDGEPRPCGNSADIRRPGPSGTAREHPSYFHYNLLNVVHCGAEAVFAPLGAAEDQYVEWKSVLPYAEDEVQSRFGFEPKGQAQLIVGLLAPATLLDILRDFVIYEPEKGRIAKKLPRYQQYRTVRAAMTRILEGRRSEERGGVVWHTQGSGKSLTMLWLATKLRREPRLGNPKILVVTDRTQLDRQITETFQRCGFPAPRQASSTRELRQLLTSNAGHTVMTTVQKFEDSP